mgnify:CR=1 FL=1|tara:strand:- start:92 stop:634 length:543 start_codon:yes stop_codon:yes gene_type:complete
MLDNLSGKEVFLDIETTFNKPRLLVIGLKIDDRIYQFYNREKNEISLVEQAIEVLPEKYTLITYGHFDIATINNLLTREGREDLKSFFLPNIDLLKIVRSQFDFEKNSLKMVANQFGFTWPEEDLATKKAVEFFLEYEKNGDEVILNNMLKYNSADLRATKLIFEKLSTLKQQPTLEDFS